MENTFLMVCARNEQAVKDNTSIEALLASDLLSIDPEVNYASEQTLARAHLIESGLRSDAEVLLFIDTGIRFRLGDVESVVARAAETKGIAGGFYPHPEMGGYNLHLERTHSSPADTIIRQRFEVGPKSRMGPQRVDAVGTGFMAFHRSAPDAIVRAFPQLRTPGRRPRVRATWLHQALLSRQDGSTELSSDHSFCYRARVAGVPVEALPSAAVGHRQPWWLTGEEPPEGRRGVVVNQRGLR